MKSYSILLLLLVPLFSTAQDWQWAKTFGSEGVGHNWSGEDYLQMEVDDSGNVYICGLTYPDAVFDGDTIYRLHPDTINGSDIFLAKYDCQGNRQWIQHFGNLTVEKESEIFFALNKKSAQLMVYFWARYETISFQDTLYNYTNNEREIVAIFNTEGKRLSLPHYVNNASGITFIPHVLEATETGFVFMGESRGDARFPTQNGYTDSIDAAYPFIVHLDSNGLYQKHVVIEHEKFFDLSTNYGFTSDKHGAYYFTGTLNDNGDSLVSGNVRVGRTNQWANGITTKFDDKGKLVWYHKTNGLLLEGLVCIDVDENGEVAAGGIGSKDVIIGQDTLYKNGSLGNRGTLLIILDENGKYLSNGVSDLPDRNNTTLRNVEFTANSSVLVYDFLIQSLVLGGDTVQAIDVSDLFFAEYDLSSKIWTSSHIINSLMVRPGDDFETPWDMAVDGKGSVYLLGTHENGVIFQGDTLNIPNSIIGLRGDDGFLMKYGVEDCPVPIIDNAVEEGSPAYEPGRLVVFPNPNNGSFRLWFSKDIEGSLSIYSYDGRLVQSAAYVANKDIQLNAAPGIYLISLRSNEGKHYGAKVIVE